MSSFSPEHTDANESDIRDRADDLYGFAGRIVGRAGDMKAVFDSAAVEFTDLVADGIRSQGEYNQTAWRNASLMAVYAAGVTEGWANDVQWFTSRIAALEEEWDEARANHFGATPPPVMDDDSLSGASVEHLERFDAAKERGRAETLASLESRAADARAEFERRARVRADQLSEGPTEESIRQLVRDDKVLAWAPRNLGWHDPPLPLTAEDGVEMAERLGRYVSGEVPVDAGYFAIVAALDAVNHKARQNLNFRDGERLPQAELNFLREFYHQLDTDPSASRLGGPPSMLVTVANIADAEDLDIADLDRTEVTQTLSALGEGLLTLSNERLGGGWDDLPPSIQAAVTGTDTDHYPTSDYPVGWDDRTAPVLADLLGATHRGSEGGREFSANLLTTLGISLDATRESSSTPDDQPLRSLLEVTSRNEEAVHSLLTGAHDHPVDWRSPQNPDGRGVQDAIRGLYAFPWSDDGRTLSGLTDWIGFEDVRADPDRRALADESMAGLITSLTASETGTFDMLAGNNDVSGAMTNLGVLNPEAARGLARISEFYLDSFAKAEVVSPTRVNNGGLEVNSVDRVRFWMLAAGDPEAANTLNAAVQEYQASRYDDFVNDDAGPNTVGRETGRLRGYLDLAIIFEARARENYASDDSMTAEESTTEQKQQITFVSGVAKEITNNLIAQNDWVKAGVGVGNEFVKFGQGWLMSPAPEGEDDFRPRLPTTGSEGDIRFATMMSLADAAVANNQLDPADLPAYREYHRLGAELERHASAGDQVRVDETVDELANLAGPLDDELLGPLRERGLYDDDMVARQQEDWFDLVRDPDALDIERFHESILVGEMRRNQPAD